MSKPVKVYVVDRRPIVPGWLRHTLFWGIFVGAIGVSRAWFGGAWIIDLVALLIAVVFTIAIGRRALGYEIEVPRAEMRAWVDAGMPAEWPKAS